jgi:NAD(P)-dependent dehydrogenase (short-subunit alcohol dehydrogenase family)
LIGVPDVAIIAPGDLERVPLRGMGSAQHVAEVALWLASPAAGFITGQAQVLDAGLLSTFAPVMLPVGP